MENKLKISENTVVHCVTEELADEVLRIAGSLGYKFVSSFWETYKHDTVYYIHEETFGSLKKVESHYYKVISAQDFINLHKKEIKFTPSTEEVIKAKIGKITKLELIPTGEGIKESDGKLNYELDFEFIQAMAERMSKNKHKYKPYNWKLPIDVESLKQSLFRHVIEVMKGNYEDDGMELGHVLGVALNAMMIYYQLKHNDNSRTT